ncbi:MAG: SRPBCC domain-containing protein [Chthoniobacterales bacterium]
MTSAVGSSFVYVTYIRATPERVWSALRWRNEFKPEYKAEGWSLCVMEIEPVGEATKLTVSHSMERDGSELIRAVSGGWPQILSNLKSLLETGSVVLTGQEP